MKATKRVLSLMLVLCMLVGALPGSVFAAEPTAATTFSDVANDAWYHDAVVYASANNLMKGTGGDQFSPNGTTTRSEIVMVLHRIEGEAAASKASTFADVKEGDWFAKAVDWAADKEIVKGYENGNFGPADVVTRQDLATIIYRYAQYKKLDVAATADISTFTDSESVSEYAVDAVKWAVGQKLINGTDANALNPTGGATRAEFATIAMRFCKSYNVLPTTSTGSGSSSSHSGGSSGGSGGGSTSRDPSKLNDGSTVGAKSDKTASAEREAKNAKISQDAATQGMVLLDNSGKALPIAKSGKVALYGVGVYNTIKGGTGSGDVYLKDGANINVLQGFTDAGYTIANEEFLDNQVDLFKNWKPTGGGGMFSAPVYQEPAYTYNKTAKTLDGYTIDADATAIYVIARNSGEFADRKAVKGDYYRSDAEVANLTAIGELYEKVVVVLNTGGIIDTNFYHGKAKTVVEEGNAKIEGLDSLLLMSQAGQNGGHALVQVLNGTVNPSGKLTDTWAINYTDYPSAGSFSHNDKETFQEIYNDDIYVGYRYFDTFGLDVAYPFGYGESYTDFEMEVTDVTTNHQTTAVTVEVTNTGAVDGKEVVQVYFSAPAGAIDKPYQELAGYKKVAVKASQSETVTVTFNTADMSSYDEAKEAYVLEDGVYTIRVGNSSRNTTVAAEITLDKDVVTEEAKNQFGLTKDMMKNGTYDNENGKYVLTFTNPRATNKDQLGAVTYPVKKIDSMLDETVKAYMTKGTDFTSTGLTATKKELTLSESSFSGDLVKHEYDNGAITTYVSGNADKDSAKYAAGKTDSATETFKTERDVYALGKDTLIHVVAGEITMEELVASMSNVELADLVEGGSYDGNSQGNNNVSAVVGSQAESVYGAAGETTSNLYTTRFIPNVVMSDGPAGIRITNDYIKYDLVGKDAKFDPTQTYYTAIYSWGGARYTKVTLTSEEEFKAKLAETSLYTTTNTHYYQYCTAFPIGTMLAQTWDLDVIEQVGRAIGVEMLEYGVTSFLAPGMNIHRNPLCGRNFEYYSEDPLVTGLTAAAETDGIELDENGKETGVGVTIKHFAFNNQEQNRMGSNSVVSERAAREIYLKGFEIAVKNSQPEYIMSSYNMVNGHPTFEHYGLLTEILRNEWDFQGFVMTDWYSVGTVLGDYAKDNVQGRLNYAGNDCEMPGTNEANVLKALEDGDIMRLGDLQRSAIKMLEVMKTTPAFEYTVAKVIKNSDDPTLVSTAWAAWDNLQKDRM